ncbi:peptidylprolyl isomerase [Planococcus salinus]|uniref:Peptidyl-prolyl cis-trans isomerase n=1 Tax=Planococcus salinus TaxID=1848460 RepID=A0A3M8P7N1_9BACL|nr:peptidylprolyl isomerase [Planococcus salinus]RNF39280.1 peptidylprolyl isomerase [Planococcus salinus]
MKKMISILLLMTVVLAACGAEQTSTKSPEQEPADKMTAPEQLPQTTDQVAEQEALVELNTSKGTIQIKLFPKIAPKTVENFLALAEEGYYDGVIFHRVMEGFMLQSGDPTGTGRGGESSFGEPFEDEISNELYHFRGALSMANAGPGTNGSQFFIVQADTAAEDALPENYPDEVVALYREMGGTPWLDGAHSVFGQVIEGMEVVDEIAQVEKNGEKPVEDITIDTIDILQR